MNELEAVEGHPPSGADLERRFRRARFAKLSAAEWLDAATAEGAGKRERIEVAAAIRDFVEGLPDVDLLAKWASDLVELFEGASDPARVALLEGAIESALSLTRGRPANVAIVPESPSQ